MAAVDPATPANAWPGWLRWLAKARSLWRPTVPFESSNLFADAPGQRAELSLPARVRFLRMVVSRARPEVGWLVLAPALTLFYRREDDATALTVWCAIIVLLALPYTRSRRRMVAELEANPSAAVLETWEQRSKWVALIFGLLCSAPVFITLGQGSFDFTILLYVVLSASTASAATFLTPVFGTFWRFFVGSWGIPVLMAYWSFPEHWKFMLPISVIYSFVIFRHAQATHRFVVQQVRLEARSNYLAEQYRLAKDEAEQALNAKSVFLTTASHDLRQPVHAMGMIIETMTQRSRDPTLAPLLADLHGCVRSVNLMFNSLLDLSRIEAGIKPAAPVPCALDDLVAEINTLFRSDAESRGLQLRFRLPPGPLALNVDPALLRQALFNLVHNALRYTRAGGVLVGVRRQRAGCRIDVWDTGMGVADTEREKIFSPFYRETNAWKIDSAGHGLGLAVVARCAKLLGATCGLRSRLGRGSHFWLELPALLHTAAGFPGEPALPAAWPLPVLQGRCLILEDDPQVHAAWAALMHVWQIDARFATCASEAFSCIDAGFAPQAILCDQRLRSGESGFAILNALLTRCTDAHGAMISGEFNSPELQRAESEGYLVLRKPVDVSALHAVLARWLAPG